MIQHKLNFNNRKHTNSITLSNYLWQIKEEISKSLIIKWDILKKAQAYKSGNNGRSLEKNFTSENMLNKSKLISKYRHVDKFMHIFFPCVCHCYIVIYSIITTPVIKMQEVFFINICTSHFICNV